GPDHDGQAGARRLCRRPDVKVQAALAHLRVATGPPGAILHADRSEPIGLADTGPGERRLRRTPPQAAERRRGKWNAAIDGHSILGATLNQPLWVRTGAAAAAAMPGNAAGSAATAATAVSQTLVQSR